MAQRKKSNSPQRCSRRPPRAAKAPTKAPSKKARSKGMTSWKPGSEPQQAKDAVAQGDFGVPEQGTAAGRGERDYTSRNTKRSDRGVAQPRAWEHDGVRDHGAGAPDSGTGSSSGGDVDTDIIGVGTGGSGIAATGPGDAPGPDDSDGTSNEFASPLPKTPRDRAVVEPASGRNQTGRPERIKGSVVQRPDLQSARFGQGADAATNPAGRGDDSFAGEISAGEAQGEDAPLSPSSDDQG